MAESNLLNWLENDLIIFQYYNIFKKFKTSLITSKTILKSQFQFIYLQKKSFNLFSTSH